MHTGNCPFFNIIKWKMFNAKKCLWTKTDRVKFKGTVTVWPVQKQTSQETRKTRSQKKFFLSWLVDFFKIWPTSWSIHMTWNETKIETREHLYIHRQLANTFFNIIKSTWGNFFSRKLNARYLTPKTFYINNNLFPYFYTWQKWLESLCCAFQQ